MYTVTAATRAFVYKTAAEADAGHADRKDCAAVILYAAEHATRMALDAIQVWDISLLMPLITVGRSSSAAVLHMVPLKMSQLAGLQSRRCASCPAHAAHASAWYPASSSGTET